MRVKDLMTEKSYILTENDDIYLAARFMKEEKIKALPVVDKDNKLIGLVTLREIVDGLIRISKEKIVHALNKESNERLVRNLMIKDVRAAGADTPLKGVMEMMMLNKYSIVPVVDNYRKLLGIITEQEIIKKLYELIDLPDDFHSSNKTKKIFKMIGEH